MVEQMPDSSNPSDSKHDVLTFGGSSAIPERDQLSCPVCGAAVVQEKCKLICRSEICRGRVVMNCSEF
jgi:hypothetical protein